MNQVVNSQYAKYIRQQLKYVGVGTFDLLRPETYDLANILKPDELILAAMYGKVEGEGSALLVVSDKRIIFLNQMMTSTNHDEIGYESVRGISSQIYRWAVSVTLHTDIGDFKLQSASIKAASNFIYVIEKYCVGAKKT